MIEARDWAYELPPAMMAACPCFPGRTCVRHSPATRSVDPPSGRHRAPRRALRQNRPTQAMPYSLRPNLRWCCRRARQDRAAQPFGAISAPSSTRASGDRSPRGRLLPRPPRCRWSRGAADPRAIRAQDRRRRIGCRFRWCRKKLHTMEHRRRPARRQRGGRRGTADQAVGVARGASTAAMPVSLIRNSIWQRRPRRELLASASGRPCDRARAGGASIAVRRRHRAPAAIRASRA